MIINVQVVFVSANFELWCVSELPRKTCGIIMFAPMNEFLRVNTDKASTQ